MKTTIENGKEGRDFGVEMKKSLLKYVAVNAVLVVINGLTSPGYWWVGWVLLGWGAGLFLHLVCHYIDSMERKA